MQQNVPVLLQDNIPELETSHYRMRGLQIEDASELFYFFHDDETMKYITPHPVQSIEEYKKDIRESLYDYHQHKEIPWTIIEKSSGRIVGVFRFHKLNLWHKKAEMGVVIGREFQQQGVTKEVMARFLEFGFVDLSLNRIVGDIFAENEASQKLLEAYGFHKDGQLRKTDFDGERYHDTIVYSLLKQEFLSHKEKVQFQSIL
ncbi:GNAT family N-acetyltransferase [Thalassobacillus sp. CUG 92003]|uniref:GNAT family N-acetyltransferase n=1 Tax=Thalassobacillus sp. CUG 92003 TaxID=2736641 RepID=UPI0015E70883|nr:GNAT family N-acetyltransferase [Thalassobacillus sp. CUG 92003]